MTSKKRPHPSPTVLPDSNKRAALTVGSSEKLTIESEKLTLDSLGKVAPVVAPSEHSQLSPAKNLPPGQFSTPKLTLYISLDSSVQTEKTEGQYISSGGEAVFQYLSRLYLDQLRASASLEPPTGSNDHSVKASASNLAEQLNGSNSLTQSVKASASNPAEQPSGNGLLVSHLIQNPDATNRLARSTTLLNPAHPIEHFRHIHYYLPFYSKVNLHWTDKSTLTQYSLTAECIADKHHKTAITNHRYELVVQFDPPVSNESIRTLFNEAYEDMFQRVNQDKTNTDIYCYDEGGWFKQFSFKKRPLDTVYLPQSVKQDMIQSMDDFFKSKDYYETNHIPYKFVCLFWGVSGSGKTTLVQSLASHYDLNLAIIQFTRKMDDNVFMESLADIPDDCMLLLEDIDSLGFGTTREQNVNETQLSLSCILNALDGVTRGKLRLVFLTCNEKKKFSQSFIRPGRIDKIVY